MDGVSVFHRAASGEEYVHRNGLRRGLRECGVDLDEKNGEDRLLFAALDWNGDGRISFTEFVGGLSTTARRGGAKTPLLARAAVGALVHALVADAYTQGGVDFDELFHHLDARRRGYLTCSEFRHAVRTRGRVPPAKASDAQLDALFTAVDFDGSNSIDADELAAFLRTVAQEDGVAYKEKRSPTKQVGSDGGGGGGGGGDDDFDWRRTSGDAADEELAGTAPSFDASALARALAPGWARDVAARANDVVLLPGEEGKCSSGPVDFEMVDSASSSPSERRSPPRRPVSPADQRQEAAARRAQAAASPQRPTRRAQPPSPPQQQQPGGGRLAPALRCSASGAAGSWTRRAIACRMRRWRCCGQGLCECATRGGETRTRHRAAAPRRRTSTKAGSRTTRSSSVSLWSVWSVSSKCARARTRG